MARGSKPDSTRAIASSTSCGTPVSCAALRERRQQLRRGERRAAGGSGTPTPCAAGAGDGVGEGDGDGAGDGDGTVEATGVAAVEAEGAGELAALGAGELPKPGITGLFGLLAALGAALPLGAALTAGAGPPLAAAERRSGRYSGAGVADAFAPARRVPSPAGEAVVAGAAEGATEACGDGAAGACTGRPMPAWRVRRTVLPGLWRRGQQERARCSAQPKAAPRLPGAMPPMLPQPASPVPHSASVPSMALARGARRRRWRSPVPNWHQAVALDYRW